jgi:hypothetical protein
MSFTGTDIAQTIGCDVYDTSLVEDETGATYFMARKGEMKLVGSVGEGAVSGRIVRELDGKNIVLGECNHANAAALRATLPWTAPVCMGLATSAGLGDRLGLATPGHIRAMRRAGGRVKPFLAQQSVREMMRTMRTPEQVMDAATWGVLQEGYTDGFGSDADHLQKPVHIDPMVEAGFTMFTIDPGAHVEDAADTMDIEALASRFDRLDFAGLRTSAADLKAGYDGVAFPLDGGGRVQLAGETFLRAAVKYGNAIAHVARMVEHLRETAVGPVEIEVSVDETESPTSVEEHYFFAAELKRLGVAWVSLAPRFVGRMEKGVDYIGDLGVFREAFQGHAAVMRTLGPYKISIHSGSDKFSIYPILAEMTDGYVHLKTAGTSYLEAVRTVAKTDPDLYREIHEFARKHYERDKATYHVSADIAKIKPAKDLADEDLVAVFDDFDTRQALHVTFGSVLVENSGATFRDPMMFDLLRHEETHFEMLAAHLGRHLEPFAQYAREDH